MSKIAPCPWFNGEAENAANYYLSLFPNPVRAGPAVQAMMGMTKLDLAVMRAVMEGEIP